MEILLLIQNRKIITSSSFLAMLFLGVGYSLVGAAARNIGLTPRRSDVLLAQKSASPWRSPSPVR